MAENHDSSDEVIVILNTFLCVEINIIYCSKIFIELYYFQESFSASGVTTIPGIATHSSSLLSSHAADSPLSQTCTSFTYHPHNDNVSRSFGQISTNEVADMQINEPLNQGGQQLINEYLSHSIDQVNDHSDDVNIPDNDKPSCCMKPSLVHTVSTYRKQQQQLRLGGTSGKVFSGYT